MHVYSSGMPAGIILVSVDQVVLEDETYVPVAFVIHCQRNLVSTTRVSYLGVPAGAIPVGVLDIAIIRIEISDVGIAARIQGQGGAATDLSRVVLP